MINTTGTGVRDGTSNVPWMTPVVVTRRNSDERADAAGGNASVVAIPPATRRNPRRAIRIVAASPSRYRGKRSAGRAAGGLNCAVHLHPEISAPRARFGLLLWTPCSGNAAMGKPVSRLVNDPLRSTGGKTRASA